MSTPILVTGATGTVGTALLRALVERRVPVRAFVRDAPRGMEGPLVEVVEGDLREGGSIDEALQGIEQVFLLPPPVLDQVVLEGNMVEAMVRTRRSIRVVKVSAVGAAPEAPLRIARWHAVSEAQLRNAGLPTTILRPHYFMQNLLEISTIQAEGLLYGAFGDTPFPILDVRDLADVAAEILTSGDAHVGGVYELTGPRLLSFPQIAAVLSAVLDRPIRYVNLPIARYHETLIGEGVPDWLATDLTTLARQMQTGAPPRVASTTIDITGHPGRTLEQFVRDHVDAFRPPVRKAA